MTARTTVPRLREQSPQRYNEALIGVNEGVLNDHGTLELDDQAATTTALTDSRIGIGAMVVFQSLSADAAALAVQPWAALATTQNTVTVTHSVTSPGSTYTVGYIIRNA